MILTGTLQHCRQGRRLATSKQVASRNLARSHHPSQSLKADIAHLQFMPLPCHDHVAGRTLATVKGDLELHRVRFAYPARIDAPVFKDFSLQVPQQCTHFPALSKHSPGFHEAACMQATWQDFSLQPHNTTHWIGL